MAHSANPLKDVSNVRIFNAIRNDLSSDFQARVPEVTKANLSDTIANLGRYRPHMNEFMDALVNRIGIVIARTDKMWNNPLAQFKMPNIAYGDMIEEYQVGLIKAHIYEHDRESLERNVWGTELPPVESNFHRINRQEKYKVSVKPDILRRAFLEDGGVANFVEQMMSAPIKSDNWDEFLQTAALFSEYEKNGGFYHMRIPEISSLASNADDARMGLRRMRAMADTLPYLSTKYNAAGMPVHANASDLVIFCTPEFKAAIDVEALAGAFNMEKMDSYGKIITMPKEYFNIHHCEAILTTKDFFVIADTLMENTSIFNPDNLQNNYWLHHHQIISASRFVPSVMFSTLYDDEVIDITPTVTGMGAITFEKLEDGTTPTNVTRGDFVQMLATPSGTDAENTGVIWSISGANSTRTRITEEGVLHIGGDETADTVKVIATTAWVDPASPYAAAKSSTKNVPIVGDPVPAWPVDHTDEHADDAGETDPSPEV